MKISETLRDRFFRNIRADASGCVLWCGCARSTGYGEMSIGQKDGRNVRALAHRVSWFLKYGRWPDGPLMHSCDTPACVKIGHLSEGSPAQNQADKVVKGRQLKGEEIFGSKLTAGDVREIRRLCAETSRTERDIASQFGVDVMTIAAIHARRAWRHLDPDAPRLKKRTKGEDDRELAVQIGLSVKTIAWRRKQGLMGEALIAPKHRAPRKEYTRRS